MSTPWSPPSNLRPLNLPKLPSGIFGIGAAIIVLLFVLFSTYFTIDQGERGVILHYGAVVGEAEPGLHFKMPLITSIEKISVQIQKEAFEKTSAGDTRLQAYSRDQQPATIAMAVNYHVTDASAVYSQYGSLANMKSRIINSRAYEQVKNVFGQFDAADAIQKRALLNAEVFAAIRKSVSGPVTIDSVQIEDITFSSQYEGAVEARMQAIVKQQQAEADKQKRIIDADASAYEVKAAADAKAHQIQIQGQAEAGAIKARGDALRDNPGLPPWSPPRNGTVFCRPPWCPAMPCRSSTSNKTERAARRSLPPAKGTGSPRALTSLAFSISAPIARQGNPPGPPPVSAWDRRAA